jgi:hypothetical protein
MKRCEEILPYVVVGSYLLTPSRLAWGKRACAQSCMLTPDFTQNTQIAPSMHQLSKATMGIPAVSMLTTYANLLSQWILESS